VTRGVLLGSFMPPHAGHQLLVETALQLVDQLTLIVFWRPDDPVPGPDRLRWLREMFPTARVLGNDAVVPRLPEEHPDFWALWREVVRAAHPEPIDRLFAFDLHGVRLARDLGAMPVLIDPDRLTLPISADEIRADPMRHWAYLPEPVRPFYARTICLHGPESTGKSTLAPLLAAHFETIFVPEYGRTYCELHGLDLTMAHLVAIAETHAAVTRAALRRCNRRLILDTDPLMTAAWADMLFDRRDPWFDAFTDTADLYLLLDTDLPWVDDGTRFFGDADRRRRFLHLSRAELDRRGLPYAVVGGPREERLARALAAIAAAGL